MTGVRAVCNGREALDSGIAPKTPASGVKHSDGGIDREEIRRGRSVIVLPVRSTASSQGVGWPLNEFAQDVACGMSHGASDWPPD